MESGGDYKMDNSSNAILEQILLELQKHTSILAEHTRILDEHTREIKLVKKSVDTLDNTVNKWVFSEMDRLETKLTKRIEDLEKKIS
jgi:hypothetical protein